MARRDDVLFLFDVDGTLTLPRQVISSHFYDFLVNDLRKKVKVGIVGGSDLGKILEQLGKGEAALKDFDYIFSENGLIAYKEGELVAKQSIQSYIGDDKLQEFINFCLESLSKITLPCKRGNFIEFRTGMINVCPVGRSCSQAERNQFSEYDKEHKVREKLVQELRKRFPDLGLQFSIGGQISIDAFPVGWDKTYCLNFIDMPIIHFFGDKTTQGGNDYEVFQHDRTIGHTVVGPEDTEQQIKSVLTSL